MPEGTHGWLVRLYSAALQFLLTVPSPERRQLRTQTRELMSHKGEFKWNPFQTPRVAAGHRCSARGAGASRTNDRQRQVDAAVDIAKALHKRLGIAASEELLVEAYSARIIALVERKLDREASALLALVQERHPSSSDRCGKRQPPLKHATAIEGLAGAAGGPGPAGGTARCHRGSHPAGGRRPVVDRAVRCVAGGASPACGRGRRGSCTGSGDQRAGDGGRSHCPKYRAPVRWRRGR